MLHGAGISTYIWAISQLDVGKCSIDGSSGIGKWWFHGILWEYPPVNWHVVPSGNYTWRAGSHGP